MVEGSGILRPVCDVVDDNGKKIGHVCTGTHSPLLKKGVGMCFVAAEKSKV